jgi:UDP-GlcNAc:undecaprenyl-phosphate GlcNAc-1-phosphate transferase
MIFLSTLLISMFITMALIPILKTAALKLGGGLDVPNARKVHISPVPKVGGVAMALGALLPVLILVDGGPFVNSIMIGAWIIVAFGLADDIKSLGWASKFIGQIAAALVVILYGKVKICSLGACAPDGFVLPALFNIPLTLLVVVGVTNAINLADGLDGLAGGISLLIFICIGWLAYSGLYVPEKVFIMVLCSAVVGAIFGFLRFNTYPATVFMGDTGSQLLGFLAVTLSLGITQSSDALSPLLPLLLLGFPVLDTITVMAERISAGRSPFHADKNHFHHKLMRLGLYHTEAVVAIYFLTACLVVAGFLLRFYSDWVLLGFYLAFAGVIWLGFAAANRTGWTLKRQGWLDAEQGLKRRLRVFKDKAVVIRVVFFCLKAGVPLLLLLSALIPGAVPRYVGGVALFFALSLGATWLVKAEWLTGVLRLAFYLTLPLVLRIGQVMPADWVHPAELRIYNLAFGALALAMVATLRFTRRTKGFRASPMDFLILVIALVVPNLPDPRIQSVQMGFLAARIIVLFFGFEVLVGELRGRLTFLAATTLMALLLVSLRGLFF